MILHWNKIQINKRYQRAGKNFPHVLFPAILEKKIVTIKQKIIDNPTQCGKIVEC